MIPRRHDLAPRAAAALCALLPAVAEAAGAHRLLAGVSEQRAPGADGRGANATWIGRFDASTLSLGVEHTAVGGSRWTLARASAARRYGERLSVSTSMDLGPAVIDGTEITFKKAAVDATLVVGERWTVRASNTYIDVSPFSGHMLGAGAAWRGERGLSLRAQLAQSVSGTLHERSAVLRMDYRVRPPYWLAGLAVGESRNPMTLKVPSATAGQSMRELFIGVAVPLERAEVTVIADVADTGVRRRTLSVSLAMPLSGSE